MAAAHLINQPMSPESPIEIRRNPPVTDRLLNDLFLAAWPGHRERSFRPVFAVSLAYFCAFEGERLAGYVNVAWDGCTHAFILDPTVHPDFRRRGVGLRLVKTAVQDAREGGVTWVHVDYVPELREFYARCGFRGTEAGVIYLPG